MMQDTESLTVHVFERLGDAVVECYEDKLGVATLKRQSARNALDTLMKRHQDGEQNPFRGNEHAFQFLYGSLLLMLEKQTALEHEEDTPALKLCNTLLDDLKDIGEVLGFTINIITDIGDLDNDE